jgi:4'-phosphopantetheinyl transferase
VSAFFHKLDYYLSLLSFEEIQHAKSYIFQKHSTHFVIRRAILRIILGFYLNVRPETILIMTDENGKPFVSDCKSNVCFNLSHSNNWAYYAISTEACVGIDIEYVQDQELEKDLATFVLHPEEYKFLGTLSSHQKKDFFYRYWSQKEALVKAIGSGLAHPLSNIHIEFSNPLTPCLISFGQKDSINNWSLSLIETPPNYIGHIALNGSLSSVKYQRFMGDEYV